MREFAKSGYTPQDKIINVADKFGNNGLKKMQGSTVVLYDSLPVDGRNEYRFFEGSSQRNFPFSNTGADGNKLGVGNSMVIERCYLNFVTFDPITGTWVDVLTLNALPDYAIGEFSFEIANSQVLKQYSGLDFLPDFNKTAAHLQNFVLQWDTQINIQPLLEFVAVYRVQKLAAQENWYLRLTIEGTGAIIAPRTTF